jgi:flagellar FliL protein
MSDASKKDEKADKAEKADGDKPAAGGGLLAKLIPAVLALVIGGGGGFFAARHFLAAAPEKAAKGAHANAEAESTPGEHGEEASEADADAAATDEPAEEEGADAEAEAGAEGAGGEHGAAGAPASKYLALDPFIVNLVADDYARYLKVRIELEPDKAKTRAEIEGSLPQVRDATIALLSSKQFQDVTSFEGKALLKQDLMERINGMLKKGRVKSVLFTEFVVQ